jgi:hypothetical protein
MSTCYLYILIISGKIYVKLNDKDHCRNDSVCNQILFDTSCAFVVSHQFDCQHENMFVCLFVMICVQCLLCSLLIYAFSGGSSNTLLSTDSRDVSPISVFGATRNTSPVGPTGRMTPRGSHSPNPMATVGGMPMRKNSFVVTESQYTHVLPSVSPRALSPAIRSGQWSGRVTPSALETCMETSFIASNNSVFPNNADHTFASHAPGPLWHHNLSSFEYIFSFSFLPLLCT